MTHQESSRNVLHWTGGFIRHPVWPSEPDIGAIRTLAQQQLCAKLPNPFSDALLHVSFFAQGGWNKVYQISYTGHETTYLLRIPIPVIPFYKTESEVATIAYLSANTTIPVPRIIAWHSSQDNVLGFEWILMEKLNAMPLVSIWRKIS